MQLGEDVPYCGMIQVLADVVVAAIPLFRRPDGAARDGANGQFSLSVHVPANTCAAIYIPKLVKGNFTITESGKDLWPIKSPVKDPGVLAVTEERSNIKCRVGAGNYRFRETPQFVVTWTTSSAAIKQLL